MKDLTSSLRQLADFLDRDEFEGVPRPGLTFEYPRNAWTIEWIEVFWSGVELVLEEPTSWTFCALDLSHERIGTEMDFNPTAPQLPQPLLEALEALKK